ncbi:MAG: ATP synthase subunit I [Deltaproteobacteria bacterium]|nr:ATP synthase subunit I [Deltaproteobacteria bacterium]
MTEPETPVPEQRPFDAAIVNALVAVGAIAVVFALAALVLAGPEAGLGTAVGGLVATLNFWLFAHIGRGVLSGGVRSRFWAFVAVLKFLLLFGGAWLLLKAGLTSPLTLALGYGSMPLGITIGMLLRPGHDESPPPG